MHLVISLLIESYKRYLAPGLRVQCVMCGFDARLIFKGRGQRGGPTTCLSFELHTFLYDKVNNLLTFGENPVYKKNKPRSKYDSTERRSNLLIQVRVSCEHQNKIRAKYYFATLQYFFQHH